MIEEGCHHGFVGFCDACHEQSRIDKRDILIEGLEVHSADLRSDLRQLAVNLCWMAQTTHQAYHERNTWKECTKGVCGSMEHMLAQAGFDKELEIVEKVP